MPATSRFRSFVRSSGLARAADPERLQRARAGLAPVVPLFGPTGAGAGAALQVQSEPRLCHGELIGRLGQLAGPGSLSIAFGLVLDAQQAGEPVVWVSCGPQPFYPPDVAESGVDLAALLVVRAPDPAAAARIGDRLLRSGAFGLLILDLAADPGLEPALRKGKEVVPMPLQARLCKLAQRHEAAVLMLAAGAMSSLVSLRAQSRRERLGEGRYLCSFEVIKDKRRGPRWQGRQELRAPAGLR